MTKPRFSPSQIATYRDCPRKWAFSRILPGRPNKYAELGTAVHTALEAWLMHGTPLDLDTEVGRIASSGIEHLPRPGLCQVETDFWFETELACYTGRRDLRFSIEHGVHVIGDHKTTTDLGWAKKAEDLKTDPQGVLYAMSVYFEDDVAFSDTVELRWIYYTTRRPYRSRKVSLHVTYDETVERMRGIEDTAREMASWGFQPDPHSLPVDVSACERYGGCPYQTECKVTKTERCSAAMTQASIQERVRQQIAARNGTPVAEFVAEQGEDVPEELAKDVKEMSPSERMKAKLAAAKTAAPTREEALESMAKERAEALDVRETAFIPGGPESRRVAKRDETSDPPKPTPTPALNDLRDMLAAAAMNGILARGTTESPQAVATNAYDYADAMLKARK